MISLTFTSSTTTKFLVPAHFASRLVQQVQPKFFLHLSASLRDKKPHHKYTNDDFGRTDYPPLPAERPNEKNERYRKLALYPKGRQQWEERSQNPADFQVLPARCSRLRPIDDWTSVWPSAHTFKASVVPLPIRMGFIKNKHLKRRVPPGKHANLELMKIPNFLHLTPPAIAKHCQAIKKFCTEWPQELATNDDIERHFPIEVSTCDYVMSAPSLRDPRSRIVTTRLKLGALSLDQHARHKLVALVGSADRYDRKTDTLTLLTDRCPARHQNRDYAMYLLTALYFQSWKVEAWESEIPEEDRIEYFWAGTKSKQAVFGYLKALVKNLEFESTGEKHFLPCFLANENYRQKIIGKIYQDNDDSSLDTVPAIQEHAKIMKTYFDDGETEEIVHKYADSMRRILGVRQLE